MLRRVGVALELVARALARSCQQDYCCDSRRFHTSKCGVIRCDALVCFSLFLVCSWRTHAMQRHAAAAWGVTP